MQLPVREFPLVYIFVVRVHSAGKKVIATLWQRTKNKNN